jgi:hypothetical protein
MRRNGLLSSARWKSLANGCSTGEFVSLRPSLNGERSTGWKNSIGPS